MKTHLCFLLMCLGSVHLSANVVGHFAKDMEQLNIPATDIEMVFDTMFSLPQNTSFILKKSQVDADGYTHYCYSQLLNGVAIEGCEILVHAKNGIVQDMNGCVMEQESTPRRIISPKKTSGQEASTDSIVLIPIDRNGGIEYRYAYRTISKELASYVYTDVETGEILQKIPFILNTEGKLTTNTIYYGRQQLTVDKSSTKCTYKVQQPGIVTVDATQTDMTGLFFSYSNLISQCSAYSEYATDSLKTYLVSVDIEVTNNDWWYQSTDQNPDLYIKIYSGSTLVYTSFVYDDHDLSTKNHVTFNPFLKLDGSTYIIKLYDEDLISDDYGGQFTLYTSREGTYTLTNSYAKAIVHITGNPIRDAHWGMEKTLEYYDQVLNRKSFDGEGAVVYQFINPFDSSLPNNAYAKTEKPYMMCYGLGDGRYMNPVVGLDVMAHEFTHLVTEHSLAGGLKYEAEPGALNEGFSDIFGACVENYVFGEFDWTIGESIGVSFSHLRNMKNPKSSREWTHPLPDTYKGTYWRSTQNPSDDNDNGGVHSNSSVLNYWFYLLCEGGSGINDLDNAYIVEGIGADKAAKIAYNTQINRLSYTATFADAREATLAEAKKYGATSKEYDAVMNAWYAVGIGDPAPSRPKQSEYYILARRNTGNYYFLTPTSVVNKNRLVAVDAGDSVRARIDTVNAPLSYLWTIETSADSVLIKASTNQYLFTSAAKSAKLSDTGIKLLQRQNADGTYTYIYPYSATENWYLSLAAKGNDYFVFYANENQFTHILLMQRGASTPTRLDVAEQSTAAKKYFRDGQIYILRDGKTYNLQGEEVK